jgi:hypothetical protein
LAAAENLGEAQHQGTYPLSTGDIFQGGDESVLLRRTFRLDGKVRNETVANLSTLPAAAITAIEAALKGQMPVAAGSEFTTARSLPHGDAAAVEAMAHTLGMPALLGPRCRDHGIWCWG